MTTPAYSTLTITDALPDGRAFEIRYLNMTDAAPAASVWADALGDTRDTDTRKAAYMTRLELDPDAPTVCRTVWHGTERPGCQQPGTHECPDYPERRWLAHWRDELARLNGTDSETAKTIIREAVDAWDAPAGLSRFVWVLA